MNELELKQKKLFDELKHIDEYGNEYWLARELQVALQYAKWENFHKVIKTAQIACKISKQEVTDHFTEVKKIVEMPDGGASNHSAGFPDVRKTRSKAIIDYRLTRYACYLIVMNGDPRKEVISWGQTYFAVKTRQQELAELYDRLSEDEKRLFIRGDIRQKNMLLAEAAHRAGIITSLEYATFQNAGYRGLYGGLTAEDIAAIKGLENGEDILDYMGSEELAANLFRITQTEAKMKRENTSTPTEANAAHYQVGKAVRQTIENLGGTMPEDLPTPDKSIKELENETKKKLK
ncbi:MAG: DNA damage-inducible protein D [Clostridia bacterium]|nr:DNA damage-inducible protein D [Clostridia bacterium]